jgi:hypothetical protein
MKLSETDALHGVNYVSMFRDRFFVLGYLEAQDNEKFEYNLAGHDLVSYERGRHFYQIYPKGLLSQNALKEFIKAVKKDLIV